MRHPKVTIAKSPLITAIGTDPEVVEYISDLAMMVQLAMERGNPVSARVRAETKNEVYQVGKERRPVAVIWAGEDTRHPGFFSVFLELGTRKMTRKTRMREYARAVMRNEGLEVFRYKSYPKREGSLNWQK